MSKNLPKILGIGVLMLGSMGVGGLLGSSGLTGQANGIGDDTGDITDPRYDFEDGESICRATASYRSSRSTEHKEGICFTYSDPFSCDEDHRCKWDNNCDYEGGEVWDGAHCVANVTAGLWDGDAISEFMCGMCGGLDLEGSDAADVYCPGGEMDISVHTLTYYGYGILKWEPTTQKRTTAVEDVCPILLASTEFLELS